MEVAVTVVTHSISLDNEGTNGVPPSDAIARPRVGQPGGSCEFEPE